VSVRFITDRCVGVVPENERRFRGSHLPPLAGSAFFSGVQMNLKSDLKSADAIIRRERKKDRGSRRLVAPVREIKDEICMRPRDPTHWSRLLVINRSFRSNQRIHSLVASGILIHQVDRPGNGICACDQRHLAKDSASMKLLIYGQVKASSDATN
jgi:hypothetical protein